MKKSSRINKRKAALPRARRSAFVRLKDVQAANVAFVYALERAIKFHRTNKNDPHNVGTAVVVALTEVRDCFKAYIC